MPQKPQRLEYLDSIRGLAALVVLLFHTLSAFAWPRMVWRLTSFPYLNIPFNGTEAVEMFFVLSGFLLARPYLVPKDGEPPRKIHVPTFYLRRFTRIWLPWFAIFCVTALCQIFLFRRWITVPEQTDWFLQFWHAPLTLENVLRQCVFILHDPSVSVLWQDWSLGCELQVSLLMPVFLFICALRPPWALLGVALILLYWESTTTYCAFIFGILLAQYSNRLVEEILPKPHKMKVGMFVIGILFFGARQIVAEWPQHYGGYWLHANPETRQCLSLWTDIGCFLIILSAMSSRRIQAALHLAPVIFLGRISYSVYLTQVIVLMCVVPAWLHLLNSWGIFHSAILFPLSFVGSVAMTIALSAMSYQWIEKPCIELGHRLSKQIHARAGKS